MYIRIFLAARNHFIYTTLRGFNTFICLSGHCLCFSHLCTTLYTSLKNPVASGAHCGRRLLWSFSGLTRESRSSGRAKSHARGWQFKFCFTWILGINPRMTFNVCFAWILGINPRMTFKVCPRMTMSEVFHLSLNFFKKWQKPCVKALKRSEIECLGFTERDLLIAYFSSFFPLNFGQLS